LYKHHLIIVWGQAIHFGGTPNTEVSHNLDEQKICLEVSHDLDEYKILWTGFIIHFLYVLLLHICESLFMNLMKSCHYLSISKHVMCRSSMYTLIYFCPYLIYTLDHYFTISNHNNISQFVTFFLCIN
jgi:hypothetical protein